jgi:hypothetical protein
VVVVRVLLRIMKGTARWCAKKDNCGLLVNSLTREECEIVSLKYSVILIVKISPLNALAINSIILNRSNIISF